MALVDSSGNTISPIADALGAGQPAPKPETKTRRNYVPGPGRVTVVRHKVERTIKHGELTLEKDIRYAELEDEFSIYATVAVVGKQLPGGLEPWFERGETVSILPSLFDAIELSPELTVHCGPFGGVTGKFVEEDETVS